jgi:hypothetical protein
VLLLPLLLPLPLLLLPWAGGRRQGKAISRS